MGKHMTDRADSFAQRFVDKFRAAVPKPEEPAVPLTGNLALSAELAQLKADRARIAEVRNAG